MIKKLKFSPIWNFFKDEENWRASCNECGKDISFKGGSTFNLTRHLRLMHPELKGPASRKPIETRIEEPDDVQVKIEAVESLNQDVIVSELDVIDDDTDELTTESDTTWAKIERREPDPKELESKELGVRLSLKPLEHFKPSTSELVPTQGIKRSLRDRSPEERRSLEVSQKQTPNPADVHFQNSTEDPIEIFGKSVVAQLKMLPKRHAIATQLKIQAILTEQLLEYEDSRF